MQTRGNLRVGGSDRGRAGDNIPVVTPLLLGSGVHPPALPWHLPTARAAPGCSWRCIPLPACFPGVSQACLPQFYLTGTTPKLPLTITAGSSHSQPSSGADKPTLAVGQDRDHPLPPVPRVPCRANSVNMWETKHAHNTNFGNERPPAPRGSEGSAAAEGCPS